MHSFELVYYRDKRHLPQHIAMWGALEVCSGFWRERLFRTVISVLLPPGFARGHGCFFACVLGTFGTSFHWNAFG